MHECMMQPTMGLRGVHEAPVQKPRGQQALSEPLLTWTYESRKEQKNRCYDLQGQQEAAGKGHQTEENRKLSPYATH
jgi:hypothetical protein